MYHVLNFSLGQLDATILREATRYANTTAMLRDDEHAQGTVTEILRSMDAITKEDLRGSRLADTLNPESTDFMPEYSQPMMLDNDILSFVKARENNPNMNNEAVVYVPRISHKGICYGTLDSRHHGDSAIIFSPEHKMGVIHKIFRLRGEWYLYIYQRTFLNRPDFEDPYIKHGFAAGFLCEPARTATPHVIRMADIISHCAVTPILEGDCIHVMPVDRVSEYHINRFLIMTHVCKTNQLMLTYGSYI